MKLRTKYLLFVAMLHAVALVLSYFIFSENKLLFIVSEAFVILSIAMAWQLYLELIRPLRLLMQGVEAIKDKDFSVKFQPTGKKEMDALIGVYNQMMDELRKERTKQEQQNLFLEKLIHTSPTGILILDFNERIQLANPKALLLLDLSENDVVHRSVHELGHPVIRQIALLPSGHAKTFSVNGINTFKLQKSHFIDRGFPRHFVMMEELTAEILAAEKKTYGKVIRMMAHEVNNTIGPVNSILQTTLQAQAHSRQLTHALEVAMERNDNLNAFMRNFADLVRIPVPDKKPVDLLRLLRNVTDLMQMRGGEKQIEFVFDHQAPQMFILADAQQLEQVAINILKNAMESIESAGTVTVITRSNPKQLIIRDTGKGILPVFQEHLFSPFYSTKKDGQGVGLTVIREILTNHFFDFSLRTLSPGKTEFRICFE